MFRITKPDKILKGTVHLTASKSESNRVLIIRALCKDKFKINNLAEAQDTQTLQEILKGEENVQRGKVLKNLKHEIEYNAGPAGTTLRFLTAYFSTLDSPRTLSGTERMKERPVKILVEALKTLGAKIEYTEKNGFPPLKIIGGKLKGKELEINGNVSSQFISALLLIAPTFENGLTLTLKGDVISPSYIVMTIRIMNYFGVEVLWDDNKIAVPPQHYKAKDFNVEADWSSASYWYSMAALSEKCDLIVKGLKENSLQGDAIVKEVYAFMGVKTEFIEGGIRLTKAKVAAEHFGFDFTDSPDIAQTVAVTGAVLGITTLLNGLHTLKIKETDRIAALKNELGKIGAKLKTLNDSSIEILPGKLTGKKIEIATYNDHRMAMSFAPLALKVDEARIENPDVVKKSYPNFWNDMKLLGFVVELV